MLEYPSTPTSQHSFGGVYQSALLLARQLLSLFLQLLDGFGRSFHFAAFGFYLCPVVSTSSNVFGRVSAGLRRGGKIWRGQTYDGLAVGRQFILPMPLAFLLLLQLILLVMLYLLLAPFFVCGTARCISKAVPLICCSERV
jgi:hypothetical protein